MTKLTIQLDDEVARRVADAAADRGVALEEVIAEVVTEKFAPRPLSFIAIGRSGHADTARRHDDIISEHYAERAARDV